MKGKELRARKARSKMLKARGRAQAFNQTIWSKDDAILPGRVNDPVIWDEIDRAREQKDNSN